MNRADHIKVGNKVLYYDNVCPIIEVRAGGEFLINHVPGDANRKLCLLINSGWWKPYLETLNGVSPEDILDELTINSINGAMRKRVIAAMTEYVAQSTAPIQARVQELEATIEKYDRLLEDTYKKFVYAQSDLEISDDGLKEIWQSYRQEHGLNQNK